MQNKYLTLALLGLCLASPAKAEETNTLKDWYVAGMAGVTLTDDSDYDDTGITGDFEFDRAINFSGAIGTHLNENVRGELELSYRKADIDSISVSGVGTASLSGDLQTLSAMAIGYYDFDVAGELKPYLSGGVGFARHEGEYTILGTSFDDDDTVFAYQLGAGFTTPVSDKSNFVAGYRYLGSSDAEFGSLEAEYSAHELRVGVQYKF